MTGKHVPWTVVRNVYYRSVTCYLNRCPRWPKAIVKGDIPGATV